MHDNLIPLIFKTVFENTPCLNTFLVETIARKLKIDKKDKKKLSDKIRYLVKKLEKHGFILTKRISKKLYYIFPAPQFSQDSKADPPTKMALDLITSTPARNSSENPHNLKSTDEDGDLKHAYDVVSVPRYLKAHKTWFKTACEYWRKHKLTKDDIDVVKICFESWIDDVSERVLLFLTPEGSIETKPYSTRFTDPQKSRMLLFIARKSLEKAFSEYDKAIFLTITLPPIFPMKVSLYILSFLHHRIKALIRKETKTKTPHFRANEPQKSFNPHVHTIIFGTDWLMPKHELTRYLDKHLENFLSNMGEHYKQTINKRATKEDVKALNKLGKRLLKKYKRYKAKHPKYEGAINWITRVKIEDGQPVFENPPPDAKKWFDNRPTQADGGKIGVVPYVTKYVVKNVYASSLVAKSESSGEIPSNLAFYWLFRIPFYYISPSLRPERDKSPQAGWQFLTSCYEINLFDAMEYAEWLAERMLSTEWD